MRLSTKMARRILSTVLVAIVSILAFAGMNHISVNAASDTVSIGKGSYSTAVKGSYTYTDGSGNLVSRNRIDDVAGLPYRSIPGNVYVTENMTGPIPTSDWATSFLWGNQGANPYSTVGYAIPLAFQAWESGMKVMSPSIIKDNVNSTYMMGITPTDLSINPTSFSPVDAKVDKVTDWTYDVVMESGNSEMKTTMTQGSPYAFFEFANTGVEIDIIRSLPAWIVYGSASTNVIVLKIFDNQDNDYNYYGLFAPAGTTWNFDNTSQFGDPTNVLSITANFPSSTSAYMSLAVMPNGEASTATLFAKYAYNFITNTEANWSYDESTAKLTTTYSIETTNKAESTGTGTIMGILPHQYKNMSTTFLPFTQNTIRGVMKYKECSSFETTLKYTGILPYLQNSTDSEPQLQMYLDEFVDSYQYVYPSYLGTGVTDTYWEGKALNRLVNILPVAEQLGETDIASEMYYSLKTELEDWFTTSDAEKDKYFYYDQAVGTLIGFPASYGSEKEINDHHFHYGYWIMAAAQVALRNPSWASDENYGGMIKELINDIACMDRDSTRYPYMRCFSAYEGHSWASGHGTFGDGNNQESSSEALNAWAGIILFGEVTGNTALRDMGIYLYTTEISAVENYWFDVDKDVLAPAYRYNDFTATVYDSTRTEVRNQASMVWGGKYIYGTWWTAEPLQVQGINLLPMTGASLYLAANKDYILENYNLARTKEDSYTGSDKLPIPYDRWNDIWHEYLSLSNPNLALSNWSSTASVEDGETRAHTYNFMTCMKQYGTPNMNITSNCALSAVFGDTTKTYVAYNTSSSNKVVTFSDGAVITVKAHTMYVGSAGGNNLSATAISYSDDLVIDKSFDIYNGTVLEAEYLDSAYGVQTETCGEGGLNVGYIDAGDWMKYNVNIVNSGAYTLSLRVAAATSGATWKVLVDNVLVDTINIAATGNWQAWANMTTKEFNMSAGSHTIEVYAVTSGANFNYLTFNLVSAGDVIEPEPETYTVNFYVDGLFYSSKEVISGNTLTDIPTVPAKSGYTGVWSVTSFTNITSNVTVNAVYTAVAVTTYTVNFYVDGALYSSSQVSSGNTLTDIPTVPAKSGYTGVWSVTSFTNITSNVTVNAVYTEIEETNYSTNISSGTTLEAEAYTRMSGIDTETCEEGGRNVGWFDSGDYIEFDVYVTTAGTYTLNLRAASPDGNKTIAIYVDGVEVATAVIGQTGGWQAWSTYTTSAFHLSAGNKTIRILAVASGTNLNYFTFTSQSTVVDPVEPEIPVEDEVLTIVSSYSSGNESTSYATNNAYDGDAATRWSSNFADDAYIVFDLGSTKTIGGMMLDWEAAYGKAYNIQVSTDGSSWSTVYATANADGGIDEISFTAVYARYVRIQGVVRGLPYGYSLFEVEIYSSTEDVETPVIDDPVEEDPILEDPIEDEPVEEDPVQDETISLTPSFYNDQYLGLNITVEGMTPAMFASSTMTVSIEGLNVNVIERFWHGAGYARMNINLNQRYTSGQTYTITLTLTMNGVTTTYTTNVTC